MGLVLEPDQVHSIADKIDKHRQNIYDLMNKYKTSNVDMGSSWTGKASTASVTTAENVTVKQAKIDGLASKIVQQLHNTATQWTEQDNSHAHQQAAVGN